MGNITSNNKEYAKRKTNKRLEIKMRLCVLYATTGFKLKEGAKEKRYKSRLQYSTVQTNTELIFRKVCSPWSLE